MFLNSRRFILNFGFKNCDETCWQFCLRKDPSKRDLFSQEAPLLICLRCLRWICLPNLVDDKQSSSQGVHGPLRGFWFQGKKNVVLLNCLLSYRSRKYFLVDQRKTSIKNTEIPWKGILKGNTTKYFELIFLILRLSYNKLNKYVKMTENLHLAVIFITCSQAGWSEMRYLVICLF